jgi:hypothetical protein
VQAHRPTGSKRTLIEPLNNNCPFGHQGETIVKTQITLVAACLLVIVTASSSAAPPAGPPRVTQVVVLDVGASMQKFNDLNNRMDAISTKYQSTGKARFWMTTYAGAEVGRVIVTVEYPSLISLAQSQAKMDASPEYQQWLKDAQTSGIKELSMSIVTELTR